MKGAARSVMKYQEAEKEGENDSVLIIKVIELFEFLSIKLTEQSRQFDLQATITYSVDVIFLDGERRGDFR